MRGTITDVIRERAAALAVSAEAVREAQSLAAAAGLPGNDAGERLRREWLNDLVSDPEHEERARASAQPDAHFMEWVQTRVRNPFHVTYRAVGKVARKQGDDIAMRMVNITWSQEIAWAQRLRLDDNPRVAVLSALFLREASSDPAKLFVEIANTYETALSEEPGYVSSVNHALTPEEIRSGAGDALWNPLFLQYAGRAYAEVLNAMARSRLEALAARARRDEETDRARMAVQDMVRRLRLHPLSRLVGVISATAELGLGSNDLLDLESRFLAEVERGEIKIDGNDVPIYRLLIGFVRRNAGDVGAPLSGEQAALLVARVDTLGQRWIDRLPADFKPLNATRKANFEGWKADVLSGLRPPPLDPVLDYGFYLVAPPQQAYGAGQ